MKLNKIYQEDCLSTLKKMKDDSVDVVITSPPYNMNLRIRNGKYCSRQIVKEISTKYTEFSDNLPIEEYNEFHTNVLKELLRVSDLIFYNIQNYNHRLGSLLYLKVSRKSYLLVVCSWISLTYCAI